MLRGAPLALAVLISVLLSGSALSALENAPAPAPAAVPASFSPLPCSDHELSFPSCGISGEKRQKAEALFEQAAKLAREQQFEAALEKLQDARVISPMDTAYATAEQAVRAKVGNQEVQSGERALQRGDTGAAITAFRHALALDPSNGYAAERLHDASPPPAGEGISLVPENMGEVRLTPAAGTRSLEFKGPSPVAIEKFAALFGLTAVADTDLQLRNVRVHLDQVDWENGSEILQKLCKVMLVPLSERQILVANDTDQNRRDLTRMSLRVFRPQGGTTPQEINNLTTALRVLFDLRFVNFNPVTGDIAVRAPQATLDAVDRFLHDLRDDRPTVMLQVRIYQVSSTLSKDLGVSVPTQFSVFNIPSEVTKLVSSSEYQQIVSALKAAGQSVNATTILAALIASSSGSPLAQPFATFGGGITLSALTIPAASLHFSRRESVAQTMNDSLLRAKQGEKATLKVGERYPIVTTQYSATTAAGNLLASLGLSAAAASVNATTTSIPSSQFSYEDLGLVLSATPSVHGNLVTLSYELKLRALGPTDSNGLPILTSRENNGTISTEDGQPVVIAGMISKGEVTSLNGIPLLSGVPMLGRAFSTEQPAKSSAELLITVTPHITSRSGEHGIQIIVPTNVPR